MSGLTAMVTVVLQHAPPWTCGWLRVLRIMGHGPHTFVDGE